MKQLQAADGWVIVRRAEPTTKSAGGIIIPGKPAKIDRGEVVSSTSLDLEEGRIVLFKNGEPFDHYGESLLAVKEDDVIGMEVP